MSRFRLAWVAIILTGVGLEVFALLNAAPNDTFSDQVWDLLTLAWPLRIAVLAGMAWLTLHFIRGRRDHDGRP